MSVKPLDLYTGDWANLLLRSVGWEEDLQNCSDEDAFGDSSWAKFLLGIGPYLNKPTCVFEDDSQQAKIP